MGQGRHFRDKPPVRISTIISQASFISALASFVLANILYLSSNVQMVSQSPSLANSNLTSSKKDVI